MSQSMGNVVLTDEDIKIIPGQISSGTLTMNGTLAVNGSATANYGNTYTYTGYTTTNSLGMPMSQTNTPELPAMVIVTADEYKNEVRMTLAPEADITTNECIKLIMLITAMTVAPEKFNALAHVKKYNLERHFKYS